MDQLVSPGKLRRQIALRAMGLTSVSDEEILRDLGALHIRDVGEGVVSNWTIEILSTSVHMRLALEEAIRDTAATTPIVALE